MLVRSYYWGVGQAGGGGDGEDCLNALFCENTEGIWY